jgi:hypothetical protein
MTTSPADDSNTSVQSAELKLYWLPHNAKDWLTDPKLSKCSPATRGIWKDAIDNMWLSGQSGELIGTVAQLSRLCRCFESEMKEALVELLETGAADIILVTESGSKTLAESDSKTLANLEAKSKLILRNRRMHKAHAISEIRSKAGRKGGSKTQANPLAKMKQIHQANSQANGKQSSSKRSVSVSDSEYDYNRVQQNTDSVSEELTTSPREEEVLDL